MTKEEFRAKKKEEILELVKKIAVVICDQTRDIANSDFSKVYETSQTILGLRYAIEKVKIQQLPSDVEEGPMFIELKAKIPNSEERTECVLDTNSICGIYKGFIEREDDFHVRYYEIATLHIFLYGGESIELEYETKEKRDEDYKIIYSILEKSGILKDAKKK